MDVVFDIDGTLADAQHRLHFIQSAPKNWDGFFSNDAMERDRPIAEAWAVLTALIEADHRILFITGRPERRRAVTQQWLTELHCSIRCHAALHWAQRPWKMPALLMRRDDDRRPSHLVKQELLQQAQDRGFSPKLAFEDRRDDAAMWRKNGLICCQLAEGNY